MDVLGEDVDTPPARVTRVPASLAKRLEFDSVVLVEPAAVVDPEDRGLQRLYVCLTCAVSALHVLHARPLPELLTSPAAQPARS